MKRNSFTGDIFSSLKVQKHSLSIITIPSLSACHLSPLPSLLSEHHRLCLTNCLHTVFTKYIPILSSDLDGLFKMINKLTPFLVWKLSVNSLASLYFCLFINSLLEIVFNFWGFLLTALKNKIWLTFIRCIHKMP